MIIIYILVIDNHKLRHDVQKTLTRIFAHVGLPDLTVSEEYNTPEQVYDLFKTRFPAFETVNAWSADVGKTKYDEMPSSLRLALEEFFRPFNKRLFDNILKTSPFEGWKV